MREQQPRPQGHYNEYTHQAEPTIVGLHTNSATNEITTQQISEYKEDGRKKFRSYRNIQKSKVTMLNNT